MTKIRLTNFQPSLSKVRKVIGYNDCGDYGTVYEFHNVQNGYEIIATEYCGYDDDGCLDQWYGEPTDIGVFNPAEVLRWIKRNHIQIDECKFKKLSEFVRFA